MEMATLVEIAETVTDYIEEDVPVWVWGAPGIGKSEVIAQTAKRLGMTVTDIRLASFDPVDLRGLPAIVEGLTKWLRPAIWPAMNGAPTLLFFDEMDRAPVAVLNAALQIVLDRRIGEHVLPSNVRIAAAGNGVTDTRGTNKIPGATANRFAHVYAEYDAATMRHHFNAKGLDVRLVAFLHLFEEYGYGKPVGAEHAFPTPRQWEKANRFMFRPSPRRRRAVAGLVGQAIADEFESFLDMYENAPRVPDILANPTGADVPDMKPSLLFAVAVALARAAKPDNFDAVQTYLRRIPKEFAIRSTVDAVTRDPALKRTRAYVEFEARNQSVTV
jgi:hypothetical protein